MSPKPLTGSAVKLNIKNLPKTDSISVGDYILVETDAGSRIIDFGDIVITKDLVSFAPELSAQNTAIQSNISRTTTITGAILEGKQELFVKGLSSASGLSGNQIYLKSLDGETAIRIYPESSHDVLSFLSSISSTRVVHTSSGNSMEWSSAFNTTKTYSAAWVSTNTDLYANSAIWHSTNKDVNANSGHWHSAYLTVSASSGAWGGGSSKWTDGGAVTYLTSTGDKVAIGGSAGNEKLSVYGNVSANNIVYGGNGGLYSNGNSVQWSSAYTTGSALSTTWASAAAGGWTDDGAVVRLTTAGDNVGIGKDHTIFALKKGSVLFKKKKNNKVYVSVEPK